MNPQGCGFGVVRKPFYRQCTYLYTGIRCTDCGADASFFVQNPDRSHYGRGAVGYTTGVRPKGRRDQTCN